MIALEFLQFLFLVSEFSFEVVTGFTFIGISIFPNIGFYSFVRPFCEVFRAEFRYWFGGAAIRANAFWYDKTSIHFLVKL